MRFFTTLQQLLAICRGLFASLFLVRTWCSCLQLLHTRPKALAGQKTVFEALTRHSLQIRVREPVSLSSLKIFLRHVRTRNAFIIGCKRDRHVVLEINGQRMLCAGNPENQVIAGETYL